MCVNKQSFQSNWNAIMRNHNFGLDHKQFFLNTQQHWVFTAPVKQAFILRNWVWNRALLLFRYDHINCMTYLSCQLTCQISLPGYSIVKAYNLCFRTKLCINRDQKVNRSVLETNIIVSIWKKSFDFCLYRCCKLQ